jgi:hypothetical protein
MPTVCFGMFMFMLHFVHMLQIRPALWFWGVNGHMLLLVLILQFGLFGAPNCSGGV